MYKTCEFINLKNLEFMKQKYGSNMQDKSGLYPYSRNQYSQGGEDGVFEQIFKEIGITNGFFVEFGSLPGMPLSNTLNLKNVFNMNGILFDGGHEDIENNVKQEFITSENINLIFQKYDVPKEFDFLSIDIDGNDFYVWQAIEDYRPRVLIIETNQFVPCDINRIIVHDPDFHWDGTCYYGAGIKSIVELGKLKGYSLICQLYQNSIFIADEEIPKMKTENLNINNIEKHYKPCLNFEASVILGNHWASEEAGERLWIEG